MVRLSRQGADLLPPTSILVLPSRLDHHNRSLGESISLLNWPREGRHNNKRESPSSASENQNVHAQNLPSSWWWRGRGIYRWCARPRRCLHLGKPHTRGHTSWLDSADSVADPRIRAPKTTPPGPPAVLAPTGSIFKPSVGVTARRTARCLLPASTTSRQAHRQGRRAGRGETQPPPEVDLHPRVQTCLAARRSQVRGRIADAGDARGWVHHALQTPSFSYTFTSSCHAVPMGGARYLYCRVPELLSSNTSLQGLFYLVDKIDGYRRLFDVNDTSLAHPYRLHERVPVWLLAVVTGLGPAIIIVLLA